MNKEDEIIGKITQGKISIKQARKLLKQYAQQRERETAINFAEHVLNEVEPGRKILNDYVGYRGMFDLWYTNHQNKEI
jgi:hypothetical protein